MKSYIYFVLLAFITTFNVLGQSTSGLPAPSVASGGAVAQSCVGNPGNTIGKYLSQCQAASGAVYACNNSAGCSVAGDWVSVGVTMPNSSTNGDLACFNGVTGTILSDCGILPASLAPLASPTFTGTPSAPTATAGTSSTQLATTAFVANQVQALPPYEKIGNNLYIPADNMYQATLPTPLTSTWTALSTQTGTLSTATSGNVSYINTAVTMAFLADASHVASIEGVFKLGDSSSLGPTTAGIFFYDSTNSKLYTFIGYTPNNSEPQLVLQIYTFSGSGNPALSSNAVSMGRFDSTYHLKGSVSGGTLTWSYSLDGGGSYIAITTTQAVGTIAKLGICTQQGISNFLSVVTN